MVHLFLFSLSLNLIDNAHDGVEVSREHLFASSPSYLVIRFFLFSLWCKMSIERSQISRLMSARSDSQSIITQHATSNRIDGHIHDQVSYSYFPWKENCVNPQGNDSDGDIILFSYELHSFFFFLSLLVHPVGLTFMQT